MPARTLGHHDIEPARLPPANTLLRTAGIPNTIFMLQLTELSIHLINLQLRNLNFHDFDPLTN